MLKTVSSNLPAVSFDGIATTLKGVFGNEMPKEFAFEADKLAGIITDNFSIHLRRMILDDEWYGLHQLRQGLIEQQYLFDFL